jgi:hypothetical protein
MAFGRRLTQLRALVDRLERLPASPRREWMLEETRARMADVETGDEPRPMRTLDEQPPAPPRKPPRSGVRNGDAAKRPISTTVPAKTPLRHAQPKVSTQQPALPRPALPPIAGSDPGAAMLTSDELLWLGDPSGDSFTEPGDGPTGTAPWRRGLRG